MNKTEIKIIRSGSVPVIKELCRIAKIKETMNEIISWRKDNSRIWPGILIETLIMNILCDRSPLYKVQEFWANQDLKSLYPDVLNLSHTQLNDDAYGSVLEELSEIGHETILGTISLNLLQAHNEGINFAHLDTTSKSVQGRYENQAEGDFDIKRGHSKDYRPDLKQFKFGLAVQQNGLPVMGEMLSGNKADVIWNPEATIQMKKFFEDNGFKNVIFVSDCALISSDALTKLKDTLFISRLPETFNLAKNLKKMALEKDQWLDVGQIAASNHDTKAKYKLFSTRRELEGKEYRFIIVHSSTLEETKKAALQRKVAKQKSELEKKAAKLSALSFACEPDAVAALKTFLSDVTSLNYNVEGNVSTKVKKSYGLKGKPKKGVEPEVSTTYHIDCNVGDIKMTHFEHLLKLESMFILITSVMSEERYDDLAILKEYKQQNSVEQKFAFLKKPVYLGPVYLKNNKRIKGLGYIFVLALMIAAYLEYRVRKELKVLKKTVKTLGNKKTATPSVITILEILGTISIIIINGVKIFPDNINPEALQIVALAGFKSEIYLHT